MKWLREEILSRLEGWAKNQQATEAQRSAYGRCALPPHSLSSGAAENGGNSLRLLEQDGWDGDCVTGLSAAQADLFFSGGPAWPGERDIFRMGLFFHDGFYETLALILKGRWERFLYERCPPGQALQEKGAPAAPADDERCLIEFSHRIEELMDCNSLFDMMQQHRRFAENNGFDRVSLLNLVHAMVIARLQTYNTCAPEFKAFVQKQIEEKHMLEGREALQERYEEAKAKWIRLKDTIGRLLLHKEMVKDENIRVKARWAEEFGEEWLEVIALESTYQEISLFIDIKEMNPELSYTDTAELVKENVQEKLRQQMKLQSQLKLQMAIGRRLGEKQALVSDLPLDDLFELAKKAEEMLRATMTKIYKNTHPDRTEREAFTTRQLSELAEIYRTVNEIKETQGPDTYLMLPVLMQMCERVEKIWADIGLSTDDDQFFDGEGDDVMPRVEIKLKDLEEEEYKIRNDIYVISTDPEVCAKKIDLQSAGSKAQRRSAIEQTRRELEKKISAAAAEAGHLFKGVKCKWN